MKCFRALSFALALLLPLFACAVPVEFSFKLKRIDGNPFARQIWAEVVQPDGHTVLLPAFVSATDTWSVRARATALGTYQLGAVKETEAEGLVVREAKKLGPGKRTVKRTADPRGAIGIDPRDPRRFAFADGTPFVPLGGNLAWPVGPRDHYFAGAFAKFQMTGLNWTRIWMCHWGGTNLDWLPDDLAPSPPLGTLHLRVATFWDSIVESAEEHDIHFQLVLQHHGQWSTGANANWQFNPWNVANGGFLSSPKQFFSDPKARELTKLKYRYIVARWGYSTAIMAWELFNEVMWTDARAGTPADNAAVAAWHAEMADYVRTLDPYHHLVTTSDDDLDHPLYAKMDFLQPHLYATNLLPSVRHFDLAPSSLDRPIFYGEVGEDNVPRLTDEQKRDAFFGLPTLWSGLMGDGTIPAQLWYTEELIFHGNLPQYATLARFFRANGLDRRTDLTAFSAVVESTEQMPLVIQPALNWHRCPAATITVPLDGREPSALALVPRHFVNAAPAAGQRFPGRLTLQLDYPRAAEAKLRIASTGAAGASLRLLLDGATLTERSWPATTDGKPLVKPVAFTLPVAAGHHTLVIENPRGEDWFEFAGLDTGLTVSPLAAVGRRAPDRVCLWLWHRDGIYTKTGAAPVAGTLVLDALPAGSWRLVWWDLAKGEPAPAGEIAHAGGTLRLPTPPIGRHAAVSLELIR
jgi:hypothetical protein